jgi:hypothetical protein
VRPVVAMATRMVVVVSEELLAPRDLGQWRSLRQQLQQRREGCRRQQGFRQAPEAYLRGLEEFALRLP